MRRSRVVGWLTAAAVLGGCSDAPQARTTDTTRTLLSQPSPEDVSTPIDASRLPVVGEPIEVDRLGMNMGSVEAPVKVIEFVDFGCGFCRQFQLETFPTLRAEFIDTDMVEWKFMPFVAGMFDNSQAVTYAAECGLAQSPRLFGLFSELLWIQQSEWKRSDDPEGLARRWITELGGDTQEYDACLDDGSRLRRVDAATALAAQLGVRSTPTFWLVGGGPIQGALPLDAFRQIFTAAYEELSGAAEPEQPGQGA